MTHAPVSPNTYCYDYDAKNRHQLAVKRFYRKVIKALKEKGDYNVTIRFNPGGIAVWGEVYAKVYLSDQPVVEFYNIDIGSRQDNAIIVRQWDGRNSGRNWYTGSLESLVTMIQSLAAEPFVRF